MSRSLHIAIADDEELMRMYLEETLPDLGHTVVLSARDGAELVERVHQARPDLVITDIRMPRLNGMQAAVAISEKMQVPFLFITGFSLEDYPPRPSLVCTYLRKPVNRHGLREGIHLAMVQSRQRWGG